MQGPRRQGQRDIQRVRPQALPPHICHKQPHSLCLLMTPISRSSPGNTTTTKRLHGMGILRYNCLRPQHSDRRPRPHPLFEPASNFHVIEDLSLALNINDNGPITRIRGSVPGGIEVRSHGALGDLGTGPISPSFTRNFVSGSAALAAGYHVVHDTRLWPTSIILYKGRPAYPSIQSKPRWDILYASYRV